MCRLFTKCFDTLYDFLYLFYLYDWYIEKMCICWGWEDTLYFRPPGVFKWKIVFSGTSLQNFLDSKKIFLTKTLFLLRHLMPLIPEMVWVPLCSTLKPLLLWVTQITLFSTPFPFVNSARTGSVNRIDKSLFGGFLFFSCRPKSPAPQPADGVSPPYYDQRLSAGPIPSISLLGLR